MLVSECECVSVLEELIEESTGEKGMKYSGVWIRSVLEELREESKGEKGIR